jgi:hypothetical protein
MTRLAITDDSDPMRASLQSLSYVFRLRSNHIGVSESNPPNNVRTGNI